MVRRSWLLGVLSIGAAAFLPLATAPSRALADGWWGDLDKGMSVRLTDVIESPERFRGRALTFACVFHQPEREFNPLRTRFNAERYDNVSVWPDGLALWKGSEFVRDFPFLYVARTHPQRDLLLRQEMFTRLEVTARIEAVVDGSPFLEVTGVRPTGHKLGRKVMDHMVKGEVHAQTAGMDSQTLAAQNFQAALDAAPDLAPIYAQRIRERLATALTNLGRTDEAQRLLGPSAPATAELPAPSPPFEPSLPPPVPMSDAPPVPRGGSLPGQEAGAVPLMGSPDGDAPSVLPGNAASATAPPARAPRRVAPAPLQPMSAPTMPEGPLRPSLPGIPADNMPYIDGRSPSSGQAVDLPPSASRVVDPPLPAPAPGRSAPPRRPRLSGVK